MVEVIPEGERTVVEDETVKAFVSELQVSGELQASGKVVVGVDAASFLGESAASSSPGIDEIVVAQGVID